jgi:hypothetical protein
MSVQRLKRGEAANVRRLEDVRGVGWHSQGNDLIVGTKRIKLWRSMAPMSVKNEQSVRANCTCLYILVEMLYVTHLRPKSACLCLLSTYRTDSDSPIS